MQPYERGRENIDIDRYRLSEILKWITDRLWGNMCKPLNPNNKEWEKRKKIKKSE